MSLFRSFLSVAALFAVFVSGQSRPSVPEGLADADHYYDEKTYVSALRVYRSLLKSGVVPATRKDEVEYRVAVCLGKTKQWDEALKSGLDFVKTHRGTVWEPRGLYWLGRLYAGIDHEGYRVGKQVHRGENVPSSDGSDRSERVYLMEQDGRNERDALEAARVLFPRFRAGQDTVTEEIQLDFDLIRQIQSGQYEEAWNWRARPKLPKPGDPVWKIDLLKPFVPSWPTPKKIAYLLAEIQQLAGPKSHSTTLALLAEAAWIHRYHGEMYNRYSRWSGRRYVREPYPYQDRSPDAPLMRIIDSFPDDLVWDQALFTEARFMEGRGDFIGAERELRRLLTVHPKSAWADDAREHQRQIALPEVGVYSYPNQSLRQTPVASVSARNLTDMHLDVYRVKLDEIVEQASPGESGNRSIFEFSRLFGTLSEAAKKYGPKVGSLDVKFRDPGDHLSRSQKVKLPISSYGAYVVEASSGGVKSAAVLNITDLVVVQKTHRDGGLFFVSNAKSGAPAAGARLIAIQTWHEGNSTHFSVQRLVADADGIAESKYEKKAGRSELSIEALAYTGDRYAMVGNWHGLYSQEDRGYLRIYATTDRSVYRPAQTVQFRLLALHKEKGGFAPHNAGEVRVVVEDTKNDKLADMRLRTDEFGCAHGEVRLPPSAPLGTYSLGVTVPGIDDQRVSATGDSFRVEEYKRPEFQVHVVPGAARVRLGEMAEATVRAAYYFGGPVPGANVRYRVHRRSFYWDHHFPHPYDFLFDDPREEESFQSGDVVSQGEARTDAKGEALIRFRADPEELPPMAVGETRDAEFTVEADVQDASRRVIVGSGSVHATKRDLAVFADPPHGYYSQGDRIDIEVATVDPADHPVPVKGILRVYRKFRRPKKEKPFFTSPWQSDAKGYALAHWTANRSGYFRAELVSHDSQGQEVIATVNIWVQGRDLEAGKVLHQKFAIVARSPYYREGETSRVLLVAPEPGCTVLVTREADDEIIERRVIRMTAASQELDLPLSAGDTPNVHFKIAAVHGGRIYSDGIELFVPPVKRFATVSVEADKERYQPGEKAHLTVRALDWQGKPLRARLCLAVTDASLSYIQKDYARDIRQYFYGDRRSGQLDLSNSIEHGIQGAATADSAGAGFKPREWKLPEGMGLYSDWPGRESGYGYYWGLSVDTRFQALSVDSVRYQRASGRFNAGSGGFGGIGGGGMAGSKGDPGAGAALLPQGVEAVIGYDLDNSIIVTGSDEAIREMKQRINLLDNQASPAVRTRFADTALWTPSVVTDSNGGATVDVEWPDNLTQWRARAICSTTSAQVGAAETRVTTRKDLLVRLQAPRFFVERDEIVLSANVHNYQPKDALVKVRLDLGGETAEIATPTEVAVDIPKDGERRVDWTVRVKREGTLRVRMTARSDTAGDATELTLPVLVHGVERFTAQGGALKGDGKAEIKIHLPAERKPGSSDLVVQLNPSLATVILDALPYLADYPYGCVEQTMSRFMPSVLVAQTLKESGYDLEALGKRAKLLAERDAGGSKPVENSPYTYPGGRPGTIRVKPLAGRRWNSPVFDRAQLDSMVIDGLRRIRHMQHDDGGWGWWPDDRSDAYMSAYVLSGLMAAKDAGYEVDGKELTDAVRYVLGRFQKEDDLHRMAFEARALSKYPGARLDVRELAAGKLFDLRERLNPYSKALLAMALNQCFEPDKAKVVLRNVESLAQVDEANGTASWDDKSQLWWRWWNNRVETNAAILEAYVAIQPDSRLAPMLARWLVNNRRAGVWSSTRETANAISALARYAKSSGELAPEYKVTVDLAGKVRREYTVNWDNALFFDNSFIVPDELLQGGDQTLTITKSGAGALYFDAFTRYFSLEEPIRSTANEIAVSRQYFRLLPNTASGMPKQIPIPENRENPFLTGHYELLEIGGEWSGGADFEAGPRYERVKLEPGATVASGDLIEVELQLESKNDYEYLVFEDLKPSGCEPVEIRSGYKSGLGVYSNMELRDQKVAFFVSDLPQGKRTLTYRLRAEIPGRFHVLPTNGYAMYAPDIRAISDEMGLVVKDRAETVRK